MENSRVLVIGDIHGAYKAVMQCFELAEFDYENDTLVCLGDVCDGWPEVDKVFDELLKIKNFVYIIGNHDFWTLEWMTKGEKPRIWLSQGGKATIASYKDRSFEKHIEVLESAKYYHIIDNRLFVHGGFIPDLPVDQQPVEDMIWDRTLVNSALHLKTLDPDTHLTSFDEVYVGHTPTVNYSSTTPIKACDVWLMDTGAGWPGGVLSLMDVETKELFQSDVVDTLYPKIKGRGA